MELASLVHIESSLLAQEQRVLAMMGNSNIVIDTVLSNPVFAEGLVSLLVANGYQIHIVDVEASYEVSSDRVENRWIQAYREAVETGDGFGGRWVPSEYIRGIFQKDGQAVSEGIAKTIAENSPAVVRYQVFRAYEADNEPVLETDLSRRNPGSILKEF